MTKPPVMLAVDDDPLVLAAVLRDLRRHYGDGYRIRGAGSGLEALKLVRQLRLRAEPVALFLVDQRMPEMTGIEFLREATALYRDALRVLLTAYADTDAAMRAINEIHLDHYLMKPWDPPEERLYPVLDDLLEAWRMRFRPPFEGVRVVGQRWSADDHRIRDFLARNLLPYRWLDVEADEEAQELIRLAGGDAQSLPLVVFPDGSSLVRPRNDEIAQRVGLQISPAATFYDLVIVGAGPAGLAAAVYGASEGLSTLLVERQAPGGQAGMSSAIENYLGFPSGVGGTDFAGRAVAQATRFGAEILTPAEAVGLSLHGDYLIVELADGATVSCQALLIATGVAYTRLDVPGAQQLTGAGIYYGAAVSEAIAVRDQDVHIVGGGNSAGQAAVYLARHARSVTLLVRNESLDRSMSRYLIAQIEATPNISVRPGTTVLAVTGDDRLRSLRLRTAEGAATRVYTVPAQALFVFIGARTDTAWLGDLVQRDPGGYIRTGPDTMASGQRPPGWTAPRDPLWLETSTPGIFVAGDVRHRSIKRIASAVGEGAMAVQFIHQHLNGPILAPAHALVAT